MNTTIHPLPLRPLSFIALLCVLICTAALIQIEVALGEYIPPDKTTAQTPSYSEVVVSYNPGKYIFDVAWQGIPVANAEIVVDPVTPDGVLHITSTAKSAGVVKYFYSLKHVSESWMKLNPFRPIRFSSRQIENTTPTYRTVDYTESEVQGHFWRPQGVDEHHNFPRTNLTLDPLSAGVLAASIPVAENVAAQFDVFNGKHRFIITCRVIGKEQLKIGEQIRTAWRISPTVNKLTDSEGEKRLREATLWIDAENRQILKLESKVLIGRVRAELREIAPVTAAPTIPEP